MTDTSTPATATNAPHSLSEELEALVAQVAGLTQMSLAIAQRCVELHTELPAAFNAAVATAVAATLPAPTVWVKGIPRTPTQLEAAHPPGSGDDIPYHVVTIGKEPGLYASVTESDAQVLGVPAGKRLRKSTQLEALAYYRQKYADQQVEKWTSSVSAAAPVAPAVAGPSVVRVAGCNHYSQLTVTVMLE